jgi:uncharacterized protein (DUF1330 family)
VGYPANVTAYFIVNAKVNDAEKLQKYVEGALPIVRSHPCEVLVLDNDIEVLEGTPGHRMVVVKFDSKEAFRKFYDSPEYQAILGDRLASTDGFAVVTDGLQ